MEKLLSVIVPVYNTGKYIRQCIESIREQSLKDIEILLVDDGSTDGSEKICDEYGCLDSRVRVFHQKNRGPIASRAFGVEKAQSKYVTFVDSDDFVGKKSFEIAEPDIKKGIDAISFGIVRYFDEDNKKKSLNKYEMGIYLKDDICKKIFPSMIWDASQETFGLDPALWNKIMKKELVSAEYAKLKNASFHYGEDVAVVYPLLLKAKSLALYDEAYYYHRQRKGNEIAEYLKEPDYLKKLYELYEYLLDVFGNNDGIRKQIDLFYIHSVQFGLLRYNMAKQQIRHMFPFDRVMKGERVVLYGAGTVGRTYMAQLSKLNYCEVVLWVDKNYLLYNDSQIKGLEEIMRSDFDKIIVALANSDICKVVKRTLLSLGIAEEDIII